MFLDAAAIIFIMLIEALISAMSSLNSDVVVFLSASKIPMAASGVAPMPDLKF